MEVIRFVFWEGIKVLGLVLLGLVSTKSVAALSVCKAWVKPALYALILALAGVGAWEAGNDVAAEVYMWSCDSNLGHGDLDKAYSNAIQAVSLRPNSMTYWHSLIQTKMRLGQLQSVLDDEPAMRALSKGNLDEVDEYQFALCSYFLGQYDKVVATTLRLIRQNPSYAAPYVLQGLAYTAEKKYPEAQQSYLAVLQIFPNHQAAVEGLARAYYLGGDRQQARAVLDETEKFPFPPPARERFEALKGLYDQ
ncbi:MAG: tetratricopeptide repeat protein [Terriglobia bacterium]